MQVRKLTATGFLSYTRPMVVDFPPAGLVLITGPNGAGKSGVLEAVSVAAWGRTLRGTTPWRLDEEGEVYLETGTGLQATRTCTAKGTKRLNVAMTGHTPWQFENTTKAQDHLDGVLGDWETWRRSCVFAAEGDMAFGAASDADRKRLLEALLGLRRFDVALDRARAAHKLAASAAAATNNELQVARTRLQAATATLAQLRSIAAQAGPAPTVDLADRQVALEADVTFQEMELAGRAEAFTVDRDAYLVWLTTDRAMTATGKSLATDQVCPTCGREMADAAHRSKQLEAHRAAHQAHRAAKPAEGDPTAFQAAQRTVAAVRAELAQVKAQQDVAAKAARQRAAADQAVAEVEGQLMDLGDAVAGLATTLDQQQQEVRTLGICDTVLGTKGARAHLLHDALTGLEQAANLWLNRVARTDAPLTLRLSPYTEKKTGGTADSIAMEVEGAGGGRGYKATSGGERRRIDVAVMLALAEVACAADNRVAPTMFFDEVFDALDGPGVVAVADALDLLALDRCVVVISHSKDLTAHLVPDLLLRVTDGVVTVG